MTLGELSITPYLYFLALYYSRVNQLENGARKYHDVNHDEDLANLFVFSGTYEGHGFWDRINHAKDITEARRIICTQYPKKSVLVYTSNQLKSKMITSFRLKKFKAYK